MADLMEYKCPNCGGALEFDSGTQKMKCPFCDSEFEMETLKNMDNALNATQQEDTFNWEQQEREEWTDQDGNMSLFVCKSCGGEIVGDENTAATSCPYCGNPVVMAGRLSGMLKPDFVIPFKLDKEKAKEQYKGYVAKRFFAPRDFKSNNKIEEIKGLYVPFWLFDSHSQASVSYNATRTRVWEDSKYTYTETSYFDVYREGDMQFANIPVDGSSKMADELMEAIEPFNFDDAVDFQTAYLAGYLADKYDVTMEQSIDRANQRIKASCEDTLKSTVIGYETVTPKGSFINQLWGQSKYALYPVWILNTKYNDKNYTFAMNGQTGKFTGDLPINKGKLAAVVSAVGAGSAVIIYLIGTLLGIF